MLIDIGQEVEKTYITLIFEDKESRVSWYSDTSLSDVKFMILCTCDSLVDGHFELLDDKAKSIDINSLSDIKKGSVFFLRKKNISKPTNILLDGRRKLFVEIEPLRHIESQVAVKYMLIGSNLLKHTQKGFPHIRLFQLSGDLKRILWYTKSKKINEATAMIESIKDISIGQNSENFIKYPLKMLEDFSFSIYYVDTFGNEKTLDITCKDEREFDLWIIGVKALHSHYNGKVISKNDLLLHSKCYKEQVDKGNIGSCSKFLFYNKTIPEQKGKSLEKFIVSRNLSTFELTKLMLRLCEKIKFLREDVEQLAMVDDYKDSNGQGVDGYDKLFNEEAIVDDLDTQKNQMIVLFKNCEKNLTVFIQDFILFYKNSKNNTQMNIHEDDHDEFMSTFTQIQEQLETHMPKFDYEPDNDKLNSEFFLKELDIQLWKVEVDLENVGDIVNRFKAPSNPGVIEAIKGMFQMLTKK